MGDNRAATPIEEAFEDTLPPVMVPEQPPMDDDAGGPQADDADD